jgi:predicted AAA+ superfamily ATPase
MKQRSASLYFSRDLEKKLPKIAKSFKVLALIGPRQSGKTTLVRAAFDQHAFVSLEDLDIRNYATADPRGFLAQYHYKTGVILDEIQYVPELLNYIKTIVDEEKKPGRFILTGSQNFFINQSLSQTLAGRVALLTLLPLSIHELSANQLLPEKLDTLLINGCYPSIYAENPPLDLWYASYIKTYLERDVRDLKNITDLGLFQKFIRLCAGRIGQLVNLSSLAADAGVSINTVKSWLTLLEASFLIFQLKPHHKNFGKRLMQSPKIYFYDTGFACSLLGITTAEHLALHYLRGGLFENFVIAELYKKYVHQAQEPHLFFWRDKTGHEIDCLIEQGANLYPVEIKSGQTINTDFFNGLNFYNSLSKNNPQKGFIVYGGSEKQSRTAGNVVSWRMVHDLLP